MRILLSGVFVISQPHRQRNNSATIRYKDDSKPVITMGYVYYEMVTTVGCDISQPITQVVSETLRVVHLGSYKKKIPVRIYFLYDFKIKKQFVSQQQTQLNLFHNFLCWSRSSFVIFFLLFWDKKKLGKTVRPKKLMS